MLQPKERKIKNLMKFTPSAKVEDVLAKDEPRSLFQEYFYGKSTRAIQESVLKEMGYTPEQYAELTSVPVMKKLGLSPAVIQFSEKYSLDPIQVSNRERVMKNADDQLNILGANQVLESYENEDGEVCFGEENSCSTAAPNAIADQEGSCIVTDWNMCSIPVQGSRDMDWLSINPNYGTIAADSIQTIEVTFDATNLAHGLHSTNFAKMPR